VIAGKPAPTGIWETADEKNPTKKARRLSDGPFYLERVQQQIRRVVHIREKTLNAGYQLYPYGSRLSKKNKHESGIIVKNATSSTLHQGEISSVPTTV
jgi:hypothetical protein